VSKKVISVSQDNVNLRLVISFDDSKAPDASAAHQS